MNSNIAQKQLTAILSNSSASIIKNKHRNKIIKPLFLHLGFLLTFTLFGCATEPISKPTQESGIPVETNLTVGEVRENIFYSLKNAVYLNACFDNNPLIQFKTMSGKETYQFLRKLNIEKDSDLHKYSVGLQNKSNIAKAIMISIINKKEVRPFIYIPNDGTYGIAIIKNDDTDVDLGTLVDIIPGNNSETKTCVTCTVESGKKGQGCTCRQKTKTICCSTPGCSPTCGNGYQCPYSCNRPERTCMELCPSRLPFEDDRPFTSIPSGTRL